MARSKNIALQQLIEKESQKANTHSVLLGVQSADEQINFQGAAGDAQADNPFYIASVSKMYTVATLMSLVDEGKLSLDAPLIDYLPAKLLNGIHVYEGTDYSYQLKVYQLVHQTSGLADYFEGNLDEDFKQNRDTNYSVEDVVAIVREMSPVAAPDSGKSHYSDTNYQLLGAIIEAITGRSLAEVFQARIFNKLGLSNTYLFDPNQPHCDPNPLVGGHDSYRARARETECRADPRYESF